MRKTFTDTGFSHYVYWATHNRKTFNRINTLIKDIERNGVDKGIGKPEKLRYRDGWSRRIDETNRLVYEIDENGYLNIISCKGHYD